MSHLIIISYLAVTLDYKGLVLLLAKPDDEDFELGGRGFNVEFCIFCMAIRVRTKKLCSECFITDLTFTDPHTAVHINTVYL
jgi:hypothetical protein